uniref:Membrane occupation and recognition nexus (Morn) repeat protein n=1 Tax=Trepomonas sp. PC1 TaxID=1076344 RepID=A0A146KIF6_9EUKA|eukprot:JAP95216.1 Membrane occupation and recognition nexus (Morn) repeat protein [Trepomonas sp. PC1]
MSVIQLDNQTTYEGEINEDKQPHGFGIITYINGSTFSGLFQHGDREGAGVMVSSDHFSIAEYKDDKKEGHGLIIWGRGDIFNGHFVKDLPNGDGDYYWPNGDNYVGQFVDGLREGYGVLIKNGVNDYFGDYAKDKRNGVGSFTTLDGVQLTAEWVNGEIASEAYDEEMRIVEADILGQIIAEIQPERATLIPNSFGIAVDRRRRKRRGEKKNRRSVFTKMDVDKIDGENATKQEDK